MYWGRRSSCYDVHVKLRGQLVNALLCHVGLYGAQQGALPDGPSHQPKRAFSPWHFVI